MRRIIWLAIVTAFLTTACRAEINIALGLEEDGSGEFAAEIGFDEEFKQLIELGAEGQDISSSIFEGFNVEVPGGTTEEVVRGDMTFYVAKAPFDSIPQLDSQFLQNDPDNPFENLKVEVDDKGAVVDATITIPDATEGAGELGELPFDPATFTDDIFSFNFLLDMPGEVTEHNATEVLADGRLRWAIPITGGDIAIMAQSEFGGGGFPLWVIALIAVVVVAVLAAIWVSRSNRRKQVEAIAAAGEGSIAGDAAPSGDIFATQAAPGVAAAGAAVAADTAPASGMPPLPPEPPVAAGGPTIDPAQPTASGTLPGGATTAGETMAAMGDAVSSAADQVDMPGATDRIDDMKDRSVQAAERVADNVADLDNAAAAADAGAGNNAEEAQDTPDLPRDIDFDTDETGSGTGEPPPA